MAQMQSFLVKDDTATSYTFVPVTDTPIPLWRTQIGNVPITGQMRLTCSQTVQKNGVFKLTVKLEIPVMETLGASGSSSGYVAPPKVAYVNTAVYSVFADPRSTIADRANLLRMSVAILQGATSTADTGTLANNALTGVWAASTAPGPQFFTTLTSLY